MANITTNLGPVSAYLDAVAHGYSGTRAEFGEYLAHVGDNAAAAAASAQRAAASESAAAGSASAAAGSATAAAGSASAAGQQADNAAASATAAGTAQTAAEDAETGAQTAQAAAESAQSAAEAAQEAAEAVLESIPADYSALSATVEATTEDLTVDTSGLTASSFYFNGTTLAAISGAARLVAIPAKGVRAFHLACSVSSTKRVGLVDSVASGAAVYNVAEYSGPLDADAVNSGDHNFLVIQLFVNSDTEQDPAAYIAALTVTEKTAYDIVARKAMEAVDEMADDIGYLRESAQLSKIPFGLFDSAENVGISVLAEGDTFTLNGTSSASEGQGATKILLCDHVQIWNSSSTPSGAAVTPIPTVEGHTYQVVMTIVSGTRDAGAGIGYLRAAIAGATGNLPISETEVAFTFTGSGENTRMLLYVARLLTMTDLVLRITLRDITDEARIEALEQRDIGGNGFVFNYNLADSGIFANLINADTAKISADGYVPDAGWENRVTVNKCCVADNISTNYEISITGTPTIVVGAIDDGDSATSKHATLARVNFSAGTVEFLTGSSASGGANIDGTTIPAYTYETIQMTGLSGTEYRVEIGRKNRCPYVRVVNLKTSAVCCDEVLTVYETDSSYGGKAGAMYDFPVFGTTEGVCCFKRAFCTVSPDYDVVFIGDSITEGSGLSVADTWANRVIASDYVRSGLNCGRGGGNIDNALLCVRDILPAIRPKMVVVTIGTNGGNTAAKLAALVTGIRSLGAVPVINAIPMKSTGGSPAANELILALDTLHCRFDIATAIDNDTEQGQDSSLFQADRLHPNAAGGTALYNSFMATVGSCIPV